MNYGCFTRPDPGKVKTGQGHAAGPANGRYATVLSADSARRAAQLPCIALARYPDRSASGNRLPCLPCRDAATGVAASWPRPTRCWAPLAGPATALPRTNAAARVTLAGVRIPPRD